MNSTPEDFGQLRRLFALKRHEQPPPGYFNQLPRRIFARLEAAQSHDSVSWFEQLIQAFESKPVLAGSFGVAAFGLLLFGLVAFQQPEDMPVTMATAANESREMIPSSHGAMALNQLPRGDIFESSINPVINSEPASALFDGFRLDVQRASFPSGGN